MREEPRGLRARSELRDARDVAAEGGRRGRVEGRVCRVRLPRRLGDLEEVADVRSEAVRAREEPRVVRRGEDGVGGVLLEGTLEGAGERWKGCEVGRGQGDSLVDVPEHHEEADILLLLEPASREVLCALAMLGAFVSLSGPFPEQGGDWL